MGIRAIRARRKTRPFHSAMMPSDKCARSEAINRRRKQFQPRSPRGRSAIPEASRCSRLFPRDDVPLMHRGLSLSWTTSGAIDSFSLLAAAHPFGSRPETAASPPGGDVAANSITSCHGSRHDTHENSRERPGDGNWGWGDGGVVTPSKLSPG